MSSKQNRLYLIIALLCFIAAACVMGIHFASQAQVSAREENIIPPAAPGSSAAPDALSGRMVVVDAGHGGFDPGASGEDGTHEDELNLKVAAYLKTALESYGAQVIMTRGDENALAGTKEEDMAERRRIITENQSDIVVSVHMNSYTDETVSGPLVLFMKGSPRGERLAKCIQRSMIELLKPDRENSARSDDLYILRSGNQPCVIVECGFMSNKKELQRLKSADYQQQLAAAICQGVIEYFSSEK
ncbi:MAG: N-acetylmuramoyl-L-alanine amidase family protein [Christensenellales bacterium]